MNTTTQLGAKMTDQDHFEAHRTATDNAPHDIALTAAIVRSADLLRFDNRPGSIERQSTLGLFVAALSDRLELAFPNAAAALHDLVFSPATSGNPVAEQSR